jgi:hypothetical protein
LTVGTFFSNNSNGGVEGSANSTNTLKVFHSQERKLQAVAGSHLSQTLAKHGICQKNKEKEVENKMVNQIKEVQDKTLVYLKVLQEKFEEKLLNVIVNILTIEFSRQKNVLFRTVYREVFAISNHALPPHLASQGPTPNSAKTLMQSEPGFLAPRSSLPESQVPKFSSAELQKQQPTTAQQADIKYAMRKESDYFLEEAKELSGLLSNWNAKKEGVASEGSPEENYSFFVHGKDASEIIPFELELTELAKSKRRIETPVNQQNKKELGITNLEQDNNSPLDFGAEYRKRDECPSTPTAKLKVLQLQSKEIVPQILGSNLVEPTTRESEVQKSASMNKIQDTARTAVNSKKHIKQSIYDESPPIKLTANSSRAVEEPIPAYYLGKLPQQQSSSQTKHMRGRLNTDGRAEKQLSLNEDNLQKMVERSAKLTNTEIKNYKTLSYNQVADNVQTPEFVSSSKERLRTNLPKERHLVMRKEEDEKERSYGYRNRDHVTSEEKTSGRGITALNLYCNKAFERSRKEGSWSPKLAKSHVSVKAYSNRRSHTPLHARIQSSNIGISTRRSHRDSSASKSPSRAQTITKIKNNFNDHSKRRQLLRSSIEAREDKLASEIHKSKLPFEKPESIKMIERGSAAEFSKQSELSNRERSEAFKDSSSNDYENLKSQKSKVRKDKFDRFITSARVQQIVATSANRNSIKHKKSIQSIRKDLIGSDIECKEGFEDKPKRSNTNQNLPFAFSSSQPKKSSPQITDQNNGNKYNQNTPKMSSNSPVCLPSGTLPTTMKKLYSNFDSINSNLKSGRSEGGFVAQNYLDFQQKPQSINQNIGIKKAKITPEMESYLKTLPVQSLFLALKITPNVSSLSSKKPSTASHIPTNINEPLSPSKTLDATSKKNSRTDSNLLGREGHTFRMKQLVLSGSPAETSLVAQQDNLTQPSSPSKLKQSLLRPKRNNIM